VQPQELLRYLEDPPVSCCGASVAPLLLCAALLPWYALFMAALQP